MFEIVKPLDSKTMSTKSFGYFLQYQREGMSYLEDLKYIQIQSKDNRYNILHDFDDKIYLLIDNRDRGVLVKRKTIEEILNYCLDLECRIFWTGEEENNVDRR